MNREKKIGVTDLRNSLATAVEDTLDNRYKYIITRQEKPVAVLVPLSIYENWKMGKQRLFDQIRAFQQSSGDNSPGEVEALVLKAQEAVRAEKLETSESQSKR